MKQMILIQYILSKVSNSFIPGEQLAQPLCTTKINKMKEKLILKYVKMFGFRKKIEKFF